jgi:hypothetical protein
MRWPSNGSTWLIASRSRLRQDLADAREQLGDLRGQLTAAQAVATTAQQQAQAAESRAADLLQTLRDRRT